MIGLYRHRNFVHVRRQGVLGYGSGKAADTNAAVRKAYVRATRNLTFVPRFHGHTVHYPITTFMGKTKLIMIPRSSGTGVTASRMMSAICKLAGIHNVMIKIQARLPCPSKGSGWSKPAVSARLTCPWQHNGSLTLWRLPSSAQHRICPKRCALRKVYPVAAGVAEHQEQRSRAVQGIRRHAAEAGERLNT